MTAAAPGAFSEFDQAMMCRALALAERGLFTTTPNPRVGCVLARDGQVIGEGWHERAGEAHAEAMALAAAGDAARGATAYVTLEPCAHHGRTPPCADALIAAGVARVVAAMRDPNPVAAGGAEKLRAQGIAFEAGLLESEVRELNIGWLERLARGRPWVRMKLAASLDGRTALANGQSQWITGEAARADGHRWRARACAVLTGIGTLRSDNPKLTVREVKTPRQPLRVLVDSRLEAPPEARLFAGGGTLVFCAVEEAERRAALERTGAELVRIANANGKVDLPKMLEDLAKRGVNELHVEAGTALNGSLLREGCVDELLVYLAPCVLGDGAQGMFGMPGLNDLGARIGLEWRSVERVGDDLRLLLRRC